MTGNKERFIETTLNELFRLWTSRAVLMGAVLFFSLSLLDLESTPENFRLFLGYRLVAMALLLAIYFLVKRYPAESVALQRSFAWLAVIISAATIELMILRFHGHRSPYYAGLIVLGICTIGFIPARLHFHLIVAGTIHAVYAIPIILHEPISDHRAFFTSNAFLIASLATAVYLRHQSFTGLVSELELKFEVEQQRTSLEQLVAERTAQLNETVADLQRSLDEQQAMDQNLKISEAKFRTLFEESKDVFYISTPGGRFLDINPAGVALFGYASKEEMLAIDIARDLYADPLDRVRFVAEATRAGHARDYEVRMKRKKGDILNVVISSTAVRDDTGRVTAFRGIIRDVTKQKQLEQQLVQAQKMEAIGTLAGGIAHDFNNMLAVIFGFLELARLRLGPGHASVQADLDQVTHAATRATDLVKQILTFSRQDQQNIHPLEIAPILKETLKMIRSSIPTGIDIRQDIAALKPVLGDATQMHQVIMNLCTNAYHAMQESGGVLTVTAAEAVLSESDAAAVAGLTAGPHIRISVSDTGHGIPAAILHRIFEPYFTTKEKGKGTGLGLSVVHGIIRQWGGAITVLSSPREGSTFTIYLPIVPQQTAGNALKRKEAPLRGTGSVLFVDDEQPLTVIGKELIGSLGYTVTAFSDSNDALARFAGQPEAFDVIVTDMNMPNMNGMQLAQKALQIRPGIPVILCTGFSENLDEARAKSMGIAELLMKPYTTLTLSKIIWTALHSGKT